MNTFVNEAVKKEYADKLNLKVQIEKENASSIDGSSIKDFSKIAKYMHGIHDYFDRGIVLGHLDFEPISTLIANKQSFTMVSGKNPSESLHLGHYAVFKMLLGFQKLGADLIIPLTSDESFAESKTDSLQKGEKIAREIIIPQLIAMGFDSRKTKIIIQSEYLDMYRLIFHFGKEVSLTSMYSAFGKNSFENVAQVIYRGAAQMASILMPQLEEFGGLKNVLVPVSADQHPYILLARDVAKKMKLIAPSEIVIPFLQSHLNPLNKMSSSKGDTAIYLNESQDAIARKLKQSFTGSVSSLEGHRALGAIPEIDGCYQILRYHHPDYNFVEQIYKEYKSGYLLASELKKITIEFVQETLLELQTKANSVSQTQIEKYMLDMQIKSI